MERFEPFGTEAISQIHNPTDSQPWLYIKITWEALKNASARAPTCRDRSYYFSKTLWLYYLRELETSCIAVQFKFQTQFLK